MVLTRLVVLLYYSIWFFDKKFLSSTRKLQELTQVMKKWAQPAWHHSWGNFNFSRSMTGIKKWFWVTIEGYLRYILPKFEDFIPTGLGSGALKSMHGFSEYTQYIRTYPEILQYVDLTVELLWFRASDWSPRWPLNVMAFILSHPVSDEHIEYRQPCDKMARC